MSGSDLPEDGPGEAPRTVVIPNPGGRRTAARGGGGTAAAFGLGEGDAGRPGINPLVDAAAPIFELIVYLSRQAQPLDLKDLRGKILMLMRRFVEEATAAGEPRQVVAVARYALSSTLDDVILSRPWSEDLTLEWGANTLVSELENEVIAGDRFFEFLEKAQSDPKRFKNLIELMYECLSLGFMGRYRRDRTKLAELERIRGRAFQAVQDARGGLADRLSLHWQGAEVKRRPIRDMIPLWLAGAVSLGLCAALFVGFYGFVGDAAARAVGAVSDMPLKGVTEIVHYQPPDTPPVVVISESNDLEEVEAFLQPEIDDGLVQVYEQAGELRIRVVTEVAGKAMFGSAKARVQDAYVPVLERVANALNDRPGEVIVEGHSDAIPLKNNRKYASNYHLSLARAEAAMEVMRRFMAEPGRLSAVGKAENEPIASNKTREGRALNRRVEIVLVKPEEARK